MALGASGGHTICIVSAMTGKHFKKKSLKMEQFKGGSQELLRYVGLLPN